MVLIKKKLLPKKTDCIFCKSKKSPDYKQVDQLKNYFSDRGRIYGRSRSGLCAKHQRRVAVEIKKARHLALLPFVTKI